MTFSAKVFKAYDIRGLADSELSADFAYALGRAFVKYLENNNLISTGQKVVVGRDMRPTSDLFARELMRGINESGVDVVDIGLVSTPLFNFACAHYPEHAGGVMVTASHNPAEYNGFKMTLGDGLPIGEANGMGEIRELMSNSSEFLVQSMPADEVGSETIGKVSEKNVLPDYISRLFTLVSPGAIRPMKIVLDAGNGMAAATFPELIKKLPITVEYLFLEPDGRFPNHEANPLKTETLKDLQKRVLETSADFGLALDGDADRIGLVDEKGEVVDASFVGALIGLEVLKKNPRDLMLYDVRSSMIVPELWQAEGAKVAMCKVGHAIIKKMMKEQNAVFASELSLHMYFHDMYDVESSDLCLLYILQILSRSRKRLSDIVHPLKKYFHSGEINFHVEDKKSAINHLEETYKDQAEEISYLDGLWMKFDWGWLSLRASNTEPVLRLNLEAKTEEKTKEMIKEISDFLKK